MPADAATLLARVPPSLRDLFVRSASSRRLMAIVAAVIAIVAGIAFGKYQWTPPLSSEELQSMGLCALLCGLGVLFVVWVMRVPDPALVAFAESRVTWMYLLNRRGEHYAVLKTADGATARLRIDQAGVALEHAVRDRHLAEIAAAHPGALIGFTAENQARYASMPRQAGTLRRRTLIAWALALGVAVALYVTGQAVAKLLDPSRGPLRATVEHVAHENGYLRIDLDTLPGAEIKIPTLDGDRTEYVYGDGHVTLRLDESTLANHGKGLVLRVQRYARPPGIAVPVPGA